MELSDTTWVDGIDEIPQGLRNVVSLERLRELQLRIRAGRPVQKLNASISLGRHKKRFENHDRIFEKYRVQYRNDGDNDESFPVFYPSKDDYDNFEELVEDARWLTESVGTGLFLIKVPEEALVEAPPTTSTRKLELPYLTQTAKAIVSLVESQEANENAENPGTKVKTGPLASEHPSLDTIGWKIRSTPSVGTPRITYWTEKRDAIDEDDDQVMATWNKKLWRARYYGDMVATDPLIRRLQLRYPPMDTLTGCIMQSLGMDIPGVNSPYLYLSQPNTVFALHAEDLNTMSMNYHCRGDTKVWFVVSPSFRKKLEQKIKQHVGFPGEPVFTSGGQRSCGQFVRHLSIFILPQAMQSWDISFVRVSQKPGEMLVTMPHGYHQGYNPGRSVNMAINYMPRSIADRLERHVDCTETCGLGGSGAKADPSEIISAREYTDPELMRSLRTSKLKTVAEILQQQNKKS